MAIWQTPHKQHLADNTDLQGNVAGGEAGIQYVFFLFFFLQNKHQPPPPRYNNILIIIKKSHSRHP